MIRTSACAQCGAPIEFGSEAVARCGYCGAENRFVAPNPPAPPPSSPQPYPERLFASALLEALRRRGEPVTFLRMENRQEVNVDEPDAAPSPRPTTLVVPANKGIRGGCLLGLVGLLAVGGYGAFLWKSKSGAAPTLGGLIDDKRNWGGIAPVVVDLDGDTTEDLVGYYRSDASEVFLAAFDGASLATKWSVGPLGKWEGSNGLHLVVRGGRVVAIRGAQARVLDIKTGKLLADVRLSDTVRSTCVPDSSSDQVWLQVEDKKDVLLDAAAATVTPANRPADCSRGDDDDQKTLMLKDDEGFRYSVSGFDLKVPGFSGSIFVQQGPNAVAVGHKSPGTNFPMLVGGTALPPPKPDVGNPAVKRHIERAAERAHVAPEQVVFGGGSFSVTWQRTLGPEGPESDARQSPWPKATPIAGGLVTFYKRDKTTRLVRVEAATGKILWDVAVPGKEMSYNGVVTSASRVYLWDASFLHVFDAKDGAERGLVGSRAWLMR